MDGGSCSQIFMYIHFAKWLFCCFPPPLTGASGNACRVLPTMRDSGTASICRIVGMCIVAFPEAPIKGRPRDCEVAALLPRIPNLRTAYKCVYTSIFPFRREGLSSTLSAGISFRPKCFRSLSGSISLASLKGVWPPRLSRAALFM